MAQSSLRQFADSPMATAMTLAVVGLALSLPALLLVGVSNGQALTDQWQGQGDITIFMEQAAEQAQAQALADRLRDSAPVESVSIVSPAQALGELESLTGFAAAVDGLDYNPLPWLVVVSLAAEASQTEIVNVLDLAREEPQVEMAQFDLAWLERLEAALGIARTASVVIAFLLSMTVLLVIGNTIRLDIENRRTQIEITRLVGGSDGFVRRPFLYAGLWYGLAGGILAALLVMGAVMLLSRPVANMTDLYGSNFKLTGMGLTGFGLLCGVGALIGLLGAWLSVGRHLRDIEPA